MIPRALKLIWHMVLSNLDFISYAFMMWSTVAAPGFLTMVYPLSVFGYAALEETRPRKTFWYFIIFYTQILLMAEFLLSFSFWSTLFEIRYQ